MITVLAVIGAASLLAMLAMVWLAYGVEVKIDIEPKVSL